MNGPAPTDAAPLLARILGEVPRRYRLGELPAPFAAESDPHRANQLAILIEHARLALAAGQPPDPAIKERFLHCLEALIRDAMQPEGGDPTYQAMVLRNHSGPVQEYVALAVQQAQDSRRVQSLLNAFAHPAKLERLPAGALRDRLAILQGHVGAARWAQAATLLQQQAPEAEAGGDAAVKAGLHRLQHDPALPRLLRLEALQADAEVRRYQSLWERQGPPANSHAAA
ncbi:MAG TPA: 3-deoxy-D-arabino-heptulosonate 7-phosphate synthase, partial [Burkholderiaceae bacterium]|nr:3-deoxy-D-arabino-heptulosonate 7-phosphate synthase [Burkholderiaceae bacterium]